jgi:hypothetical protein
MSFMTVQTPFFGASTTISGNGRSFICARKSRVLRAIAAAPFSTGTGVATDKARFGELSLR